jgi:hypothetical protein
VPHSLTILPDPLAVCRLPRGSALPDWARAGSLCAVTWTRSETSVVCPAHAVPPDLPSEGPWRAIELAGPLDFGLTGVLLSIAQPLAEAGVSIFAVSTHDTDYVLVKATSLDRAIAALEAAGHHIAP